MNAQLAKRRRTLDKHAQAMSVPIGSSSAIGLGPARLRGAQPRSSGDSNQLQVYNNPDSDDVVVSRVLVNRMLDHVERATSACSHAVKIATQARNAFEEEHARMVKVTEE